MIYYNKEDLLNEDINLFELINSDKVNIVFGEIEDSILESHDVLSDGFIIVIRNKYLDGSDNKPINHTPTIKIISGNKFMYDNMKGVPLEFDPKIKLYKNADNAYNKRELRPYMKIIKKFVKDNKDDIIKYWYINPETNENYMEELNKIKIKIGYKYSKK